MAVFSLEHHTQLTSELFGKAEVISARNFRTNCIKEKHYDS